MWNVSGERAGYARILIGILILAVQSNGCALLQGSDSSSSSGGHSGTSGVTRLTLRSVDRSAFTVNGTTPDTDQQSALDNLTDIECPSGRFCPSDITLQGVFYSMGVHPGKERGGTHYSIYPVGTLEPASSFVGSTDQILSYTFDNDGVHSQIPNTISGTYRYCGDYEFPSNDNAYVDNVELYYGYLDFWVGVESGSIESTSKHAIRVVFGDMTVDGKSYSKGDLLVKELGYTWRYCNATECSTTKMSDAYTASEIVNFDANLTSINHVYQKMELVSPAYFSYEDSLKDRVDMKLYLNHTNAISFDKDPTTMSAIQELLGGVKVHLGPQDQSPRGIFSLEASGTTQADVPTRTSIK